MALNLIKVSTKDGPIWIGVAQLIAILPNENNIGAALMVAGFPNVVPVLESPSAVADLANRRPPDGN